MSMQVWAHFSTFSASDLRTYASARELITVKHFVSSTNKKTSTEGEEIDVGRLFMQRRKMSGASIDPCGTPDETGR